MIITNSIFENKKVTVAHQRRAQQTMAMVPMHDLHLPTHRMHATQFDQHNKDLLQSSGKISNKPLCN
jgi:hypothetical protein